ncbi:hypothetical protein WJX74_000151 [Apatococcus lobatus]|uniref:U-box domain-containing protein n=1 Tax=Apatococcus lobatus TaxID=904363 RepID=A0AAW1S9G9_9CHLO
MGDRAGMDGALEVIEMLLQAQTETKPPACLQKTSSQDTPEAFLCPISQDLMADPVVAADGHTYEREHICRWLQAHSRSPMTNAILEDNHVVTNWALKKAIEHWSSPAQVAKRAGYGGPTQRPAHHAPADSQPTASPHGNSTAAGRPIAQQPSTLQNAARRARASCTGAVVLWASGPGLIVFHGFILEQMFLQNGRLSILCGFILLYIVDATYYVICCQPAPDGMVATAIALLLAPPTLFVLGLVGLIEAWKWHQIPQRAYVNRQRDGRGEVPQLPPMKQWLRQSLEPMDHGHTLQTHVLLSRFWIDAEDMQNCEAALSNSTVESLTLKTAVFDESGMQHLVRILQHTSSLTTLNLSGCLFDTPRACQLIQALRARTPLRNLHLPCNALGPEVAPMVKSMLEADCHLEMLILRNNCLCNGGADQILSSLCGRSRLRHLDLSDNDLGPEVGTSAGKMLRENSALRVLELSQARLGRVGIYPLAAGFEQNTSLRTLILKDTDMPWPYWGRANAIFKAKRAAGIEVTWS